MIDKSHPVGKLANFRDLGNLTTVTGSTKEGQLFRSDDLALLDDEQAEIILDFGVKLIIDLRSSDEVELVGRGPLANAPIDYLNLPLLNPAASGVMTEEILDREFTSEMLGRWYASVYQDALPKISSGLKAIAESDGPVLFHCAVGKDRTGIFAASLLTVLGVTRSEIIREYSLTNQNLPRLLSRLSTFQPFWTEDLIVQSGALMRADEQSMRTMLELVGSEEEIQSQLRDAGLDDDTADLLRTNYTH